ncbi:MAG TPA: hypothetical protein VKB45_00415 [Gemmatimonadales bacterium]|nr:hypothetical protein [Gemmatimonadales bacterium]
MAVRFVTSWLGLVALTLAVVPARGGAQGMPPSLTQFLQQTIRLNPDELSAASSGIPVVKLLESSDRREIAVFGIVSIAVPRAFYVHRASDFRTSLKSPSRSRFGIFSDPATPSDVAALTVPHDDVQDLAKCRPGACKLKFSGKTIIRLRAMIDSAPNAADSVVSAYLRQRAIDYISGYRARGNAALVVYGDEDSATAAAQVFTAMVSRSAYMYQYAPSLEQYLNSYPQNRPADLSEVLFWSEDDLPGLKQTITLAHAVVYAPPELPGCTLLVTKQLYADHYLDGAIGVTAIVEQGEGARPGQPGVYLAYLRRLHFDKLPSGGLMDVRGKVIGKVRAATRTDLLNAKTTNERAYAAAPPSSR